MSKYLATIDRVDRFPNSFGPSLSGEGVPAAASSLERLSFRELVRCRPVLQSFYGKLLALSVTSG